MPGVPLLGATAGAMAVLAAFSTILPELELTSDRYVFREMRLKAKHLGIGAVFLAVFLWLSNTAAAFGPVAMLAGTLFGWTYVEMIGFGAPLAIQRYLFEKRRRRARLSRMSVEEFIHAEIDPILEKISRKGLRSLTRAERKILESGRDKISHKGEEPRGPG